MAHEGLRSPSIEGIDHTLIEAQFKNAEIDMLHEEISSVSDLKKRKGIEVRLETLFREMMSALYSVLDQIYYYLYCRFQNNGHASFKNAAFDIKVPVKKKLKWSADDNQHDVHASRKCRNAFVNDQCEKIFGKNNLQDLEIRTLRQFQRNMLQLQAVIEIDSGGHNVRSCPEHLNNCPNGCLEGSPKLVRADEIKQEVRSCEDHNPRQCPDGCPRRGKIIQESAEPIFNPSSINWKPLESVKDRAWTDTVTFQLLHFFRNYTAHRALISCQTKAGYFNMDTHEFTCEGYEGAGDCEPWVKLEVGSWVLVPEIKHLRDTDRTITFHPHPLLKVVCNMLEFVKAQRDCLLDISGDEFGNSNIDVTSTGDHDQGYTIVFKRADGGEVIESKQFDVNQHLFPFQK